MLTMKLSQNLCALIGRVAATWENATLHQHGLTVRAAWGYDRVEVENAAPCPIDPIAFDPRALSAWYGLKSDVNVGADPRGGVVAVTPEGRTLAGKAKGEPMVSEMGTGTPHRVDPGALAEALKTCRKQVSKDETNAKLWAILFDGSEVLATDGHRAAIAPHKGTPFYGFEHGVAIEPDTAGRWQIMLSVFAKSSGGWCVEVGDKEVALVFRGHGRTVRVVGRNVGKVAIKASGLRRAVSTSDQGVRVAIEGWALTMAKLFEYVAIYPNGAVVGWNDPTDMGFSGLVPRDVAPLWVGSSAYFRAAAPTLRKLRGELPPVMVCAHGGAFGLNGKVVCTQTILTFEGAEGGIMPCHREVPPLPEDVLTDAPRELLPAAAE